MYFLWEDVEENYYKILIMTPTILIVSYSQPIS